MLLRLLKTLGQAALQVSFTVLLVLLVTLVFYVGLGWQLVPMVDRYTPQIEQRLSVLLDADVSMGSIEGEWERFGPRFVIHDLQISTDEASEPLLLQRVSVAPDLPASIRQLRPVLGRTTLQALELTLHEQDNGRWSMTGMGGRNVGSVSVEQVLEWSKSLSMLELEQSALALQHASGQVTRFEELSLQFQSLNSRYVIGLSAWQVAESVPLIVQGELVGETLEQLSGQLYLALPSDDYSAFVSRWQPADIRIEAISAGGELWLDIDQGALAAATWRGGADVRLARDEAVQIQDLQMDWLQVRRMAATDSWELMAEGVTFDLASGSWPEGGLSATYQSDSGITANIDVVDLALAARIAAALVPAESMRREIQSFSPRGQLQNIQLDSQLQDGKPTTARLRSNLTDAGVSAHRGAPAFWGVDGYAEVELDQGSSVARGFLEVDSTDLSMHLPNLFNDRWVYNRVNGRVGFTADWTSSLDFRMASGVVVAESEHLQGRAQFAADVHNGEDRYVDLELKVGALQADIQHKAQYLPLAPTAPRSAQRVLAWVNDAVVGGDGAGSGLIFRGRVHSGAESAQRTLQMFYKVADGTLKFDRNWPALEHLDGYVVIDDGQVDVSASAGSSLGISFNASVASVRPNPGGGSWLTVSGEGRGSAQQGLQYLQATPVTQGIGEYLAEWRATGETDFSLALNIPLNIDNAEPQIDLSLAFQDNSLEMPEFDLAVSKLSGELLYSAADGLQSRNLTGNLLGNMAAIDIRADGLRGEPLGARVRVEGAVTVDSLQAWQGMPPIVSKVLEETSGGADYTAELQFPVYGESGRSNGLQNPRLTINSDLQGIGFDYPAPFAKAPAQAQPFSIQLDFTPPSTVLFLSLASAMQMELRFRDEGIYNGLVYFGSPGQGLRVRRLNESAPGISVLGTIAELDYEQWSSAADRLMQNLMAEPSGATMAGFSPAVDVSAELIIQRLHVLDEVFEDVSTQVSKDNGRWALTLGSEDVAGSVILPAGADDFWDVQLEHLHLTRALTDTEAADEESGVWQDTGDEVVLDLQELPTVEYFLPRSDPLAELDPRDFPRLRLAIGDLSMAGAPYGSWQFTMEPDRRGAAFRDLRVNARGLRVGSEEEPALFRWNYDGREHDSELTGLLSADNLATVLSGYGYAPSIESQSARFQSQLHWQGSPAYFSALGLNGEIDLLVNNGRFQQRAGVANSALRLISIINFDAVLRRLRFSDDIAGSGLSYDEIRGRVFLEDGVLTIDERLQIIGPSSLFQLAGEVDLAAETIDGDLYITLPVSDNIPWLSGLAALNNLINWQVAVGVFLFDQIFGDQVDNLTSAHYTLEGPWEGLEPKLNQVFTGGS